MEVNGFQTAAAGETRVIRQDGVSVGRQGCLPGRVASQILVACQES